MLTRHFWQTRKLLELEIAQIIKLAGRGSARDDIRRLQRLMYIWRNLI